MQPRESSGGFIVSPAICSHSEGKQAVFYSRRHLDGSSSISYY
ncbi:MAG: hypothetical protein ACYCUW_08500 [bacterium]